MSTWIQKHSQCLKVFPVLLGNRTPWQMGSGFSCQSWLSHEPMRGSPCPSGSFAYTPSLPRIPFWFCGPVAFLVSTVLPRSSPVDGSVAAHKTAWQRWHCFQLLTSKLAFGRNECFLKHLVFVCSLPLRPRKGSFVVTLLFVSDSCDVLGSEGLIDVELVPGRFRRGWSGLDIFILKTYQTYRFYWYVWESFCPCCDDSSLEK